MSSYIHYELLLFSRSVAMGVMLLLCYSFLTALRQVVPHARAVVMVQDLVFWISAGFFVFAGIYRTNQGILRNFLFLGILLGAVLGNVLIRPFFVKICGKILGIPVKAVKKIINGLLFCRSRCKILINKTRMKRGRLLEKGREKEQKKRIGYNYLGMLCIALVVLVLLASLMMKSRKLSGTLAVYNAKAATLEQEIERQQTRTEEIDQLKEYMQTDEFAEQVAREKLGLIKDNEIIFKEEK